MTMKRPLRNRWIGLLTMAPAPMVVIAAPGTASAASTVRLGNSDGSQSDIEGNWPTPDKTRSVTVQQASNTWQAWVWRGPTFQCPWNVPSCSYARQQSKTTGWKWLWQYTWSPNERWGNWTTNLKVSDYGTYHVW
ncbi:hypothetical protein [Streptomyces sp. NPDC101234]|uniref:hypothetical protein n=1 Tax=Streptomyces sp. NPDC101234 TaxID=3366138 RepID=UPI0037FBD926